MGKPTIKNWRDIQPRVGHDNAIVWNILRPEGAGQGGAQGGAQGGGQAQEPPRGFDPEAQAANVLQRISGVARHALQAGKRSDYHVHNDAEQLYYVLRGQGKMIVDDEAYPIREGDVIYLPAGVRHRAVNDSDDWMEHVIITARLS
ncbi:MAG TPA: cupin domain-containing protein [Chloroflexota bacterium]|nr:cupin domain-containing protein [Chloroflexota bacterium]